MLRVSVVLIALVLAFFGAFVVECQPTIQDNVIGFGEGFDRDSDAPYLMNLLKRTAVFFPNGNHDKMIKAILKSRRY